MFLTENKFIEKSNYHYQMLTEVEDLPKLDTDMI